MDYINFKNLKIGLHIISGHYFNKFNKLVHKSISYDFILALNFVYYFTNIIFIIFNKKNKINKTLLLKTICDKKIYLIYYSICFFLSNYFLGQVFLIETSTNISILFLTKPFITQSIYLAYNSNISLRDKYLLYFLLLSGIFISFYDLKKNFLMFMNILISQFLRNSRAIFSSKEMLLIILLLNLIYNITIIFINHHSLKYFIINDMYDNLHINILISSLLFSTTNLLTISCLSDKSIILSKKVNIIKNVYLLFFNYPETNVCIIIGNLLIYCIIFCLYNLNDINAY